MNNHPTVVSLAALALAVLVIAWATARAIKWVEGHPDGH